MKRIHKIRMKKIATLANALVHKFGWEQSEAWKEAWSRREEVDAGEYVKWTKKDGTTTARVVMPNWTDYEPHKGTGRVAPHWVVADLAKVVHRERKDDRQRVIISIVRENIAA